MAVVPQRVPDGANKSCRKDDVSKSTEVSRFVTTGDALYIDFSIALLLVFIIIIITAIIIIIIIIIIAVIFFYFWGMSILFSISFSRIFNLIEYSILYMYYY